MIRQIFARIVEFYESFFRGPAKTWRRNQRLAIKGSKSKPTLGRHESKPKIIIYDNYREEKKVKNELSDQRSDCKFTFMNLNKPC